MYRRRVLAAKAEESEENEAGHDGVEGWTSPAALCLKKVQKPMDSYMGPKPFYTSGCKESSVKRKRYRRMMHELHRCVAQSGTAAVEASASAFSRRMESISRMDGIDEVSKFHKKRVRCLHHEDCNEDDECREHLEVAAAALRLFESLRVYSLRTAANIWVMLCFFGEAIGHSPLRRAMGAAAAGGAEVEAPLELLWAFNACMVSAAISFGLVMSAFTGQMMSEGEESVPLPETFAFEPTRLATRIFIVAAVSFISGMGLRVVHPLHSALLCGV